MATIQERENTLLERWHNSRKRENYGKGVDFVYDGMVDEAGYTASKPKIAYVLKEYAPSGQGNDLRRDLYHGVGWWWWKVAYMTHNLKRFYSPDIPRKPDPWDEAWLKEMHRSICALNLSKIGGNQYTNMELLALQAMKRREFVQEQFDLYDPDLAICGGTFHIFRYVIGHDEIPPNNGKHINWYERCSGKYVVDTYHPSNPRFGYEMMDNVVDEIKTFFMK